MTRNNKKCSVYIKRSTHKGCWQVRVKYDVNIEDFVNEAVKIVLGDKELVERIVDTIKAAGD